MKPPSLIHSGFQIQSHGILFSLRATIICLLLGAFMSASAQPDTAFKKYVVTKSKTNAASQQQSVVVPMFIPPEGGCTITGSIVVTAGNTYTYFLNCDGNEADYWGIANGTIIEWYGDEVTVQWCSSGCTTGTIQAFKNTTGMMASKTATINTPPAFSPGAITNTNQSISYNTTPALITSTAATGGSGCDGSYSYSWYKSTDNVNFTYIAGADNLLNYQPGALTVSTYFKRYASCNHDAAFTNTTFIYVAPQPIQQLNPGCIVSGVQTILYNTIPAAITATVASFGNCGGNYIYQWQSSTDNIYFKDIPGANSQNLNFSAPISQTTWYQRKATCGAEVTYSSSACVTTASSVPNPVSIALKNYFVGSPFPGSITVRFKQGGTVVQTSVFSSSSTGTVSITVPPGTYQLEFIMPVGFESYLINYYIDDPFQYWYDMDPSLSLTTGNVTFSAGSSYVINSSNAL